MHIIHCLREQGPLGKGNGVSCGGRTSETFFPRRSWPEEPISGTHLGKLGTCLRLPPWVKKLVGKPNDLCNGGTVIKHGGEMLQTLPGGHGREIL